MELIAGIIYVSIDILFTVVSRLKEVANHTFSGPSKHKDALSVMISLKPGTHHLKFIVDGSMKLSDQLPTAVDFTNILVNYLEITPNDSPYQTASGLSHTRPSAIPNRSHPTKPDANITSAPAVAPLPRPLASASVVAPQTTTPERKYSPAQDRPQSSPVSGVERDQRRVVLTTAEKRVYNSEIPQYLLGLEPLGEVDHFYEQNLPCPPSLPLFLAKSILNMSMPTKDDSSVLKQPNHTVLNHLATSSIRDDVLATSATTRYKRKVCKCLFHNHLIYGWLTWRLVSYNYPVQANNVAFEWLRKLWYYWHWPSLLKIVGQRMPLLVK